jgi:hypothetical protein
MNEESIPMPSERKIRSGSVSRLLNKRAGHVPYEHKGTTGGFVVEEIIGTSPVLVRVQYRGIERDYRARDARVKERRNELLRLRMSLVQVCDLHATWGWDDQGEIDTSYLVASADPIVPPWASEVRQEVPGETTLAPQIALEPTPVHAAQMTAGGYGEPVRDPWVADLFIQPLQVIQAAKEIEFEHAESRDDSASKMEHRLYHQTLMAIAAGVAEPQRLASLALDTQHLFFTR